MSGSLKQECLVRSKIETDEETLKMRQEITRSKSPAELGEIKGLSDIPVPSMRRKKHDSSRSSRSRSKSRERMYDRLPDTLKTECLVRSKMQEDDDILRERQELTRSKTPTELSEIRGIEDLPMPSIRKKSKSHDRVKRIQKSKSKENLYQRLPDTLKAECLVRTKDEDPEVQRERQELVKNKTPAELSEIHGLSDFPMPSFHKKKEDETDATKRPKETFYERLPDSLKAECLVRSKVETDENVLRERQELTRAKTPSELGEIKGFSDLPIPTLRKKRGDKEKSVDRISEKSKGTTT